MKLIKTFTVKEELKTIPLFQVAGLQNYTTEQGDSIIIREDSLALDFIELAKEVQKQFSEEIWHDKMPNNGGYIFGGKNIRFTVDTNCIIINRVTRTLRIKDTGDIAKINLDKIK